MTGRHPSGRPSNMGQEISSLGSRATPTNVSLFLYPLTVSRYTHHDDLIGKRSDLLVMCFGFAQAKHSTFENGLLTTYVSEFILHCDITTSSPPAWQVLTDQCRRAGIQTVPMVLHTTAIQALRHAIAVDR
jgi:hypothetical protein